MCFGTQLEQTDQPHLQPADQTFSENRYGDFAMLRCGPVLFNFATKVPWPFVSIGLGVPFPSMSSQPPGWEYDRRYPRSGPKSAKMLVWPNQATKRSAKIGNRQTSHENDNGEVHFVPRPRERVVWGSADRGGVIWDCVSIQNRAQRPPGVSTSRDWCLVEFSRLLAVSGR